MESRRENDKLTQNKLQNAGEKENGPELLNVPRYQPSYINLLVKRCGNASVN